MVHKNDNKVLPVAKGIDEWHMCIGTDDEALSRYRLQPGGGGALR